MLNIFLFLIYSSDKLHDQHIHHCVEQYRFTDYIIVMFTGIKGGFW